MWRLGSAVSALLQLGMTPCSLRAPLAALSRHHLAHHLHGRPRAAAAPACTRAFSASTQPSSSSSAPSSASRPVRVCVVGSGPAGFYTVSQLLKRLGDNVRVDLIDRLPTPFGLVRSGVAPDHPEVKNVTNQFTQLGKDARCRYLGNVTLGKDVQLSELRVLYNMVVLAYGAESDRKLGIPGEGASNVFSAREFVWWYNAHPDANKLPVDLSRVESAVVCGIGNVALDCARVLLRGAEGLRKTDISAHALEALRRAAGRIKHVHLAARRGPVQAACTAKELKEIVTEPGVQVHAPQQQMRVSPADQEVMKKARLKRRIVELITQGASACKPDISRHVHFQFYRNPVEMLVDNEGRVSGVKVEVTALKEGPSGEMVAVGIGVFETIPAELVLVSIGYKSLSVPGLPFDARRGVVPNEAGRVLRAAASTVDCTAGSIAGSTAASPSTQQQAAAAEGRRASGGEAGGKEGGVAAGGRYEPGLYVVGWLKRGPTGIIGTNLIDAEETVESLVQDLPSQGVLPAGEEAGALGKAAEMADGGCGGAGSAGAGGRAMAAPGNAPDERLLRLLEQRGVEVVSFGDWLALDGEEVRRGEREGRARVKVADVGEMMQVIRQGRS